MPLIFIPFVFSLSADAYVALGRIGAFLTAEELREPYTVEDGSKWAVRVDGDFAWEKGGLEAEKGGARKAGGRGGRGGKAGGGRGGGGRPKKGEKNSKASRRKASQGAVLPTTRAEGGAPAQEGQAGGAEEGKEEKPFELRGMRLKIPQGAFVAIVGRVGSGKSSLLQAMIGEMRRTRGEVSGRSR
jgi:ATP-binding cassette, subfamily C (CFTR/MRP), member 1